MDDTHEAATTPAWLVDTRASYDTEAVGYAEQVQGLLQAQAHLRAHLDGFAELVKRDGGGPVVDVGCGPGYVTQYLHDAGAEASGIDLSPVMIELARNRYPGRRFDVGTMTALDIPSHSVAGIVAFWSTIHIPDHAMPAVIAEFRRVLRPGGHLLVGFHVGEGREHTSTGYTGQAVSIDTHLRRVDTMSDWLRASRFRIELESVFRPDDATPGAIVVAQSGR